jgi:hypothetical protein
MRNTSKEKIEFAQRLADAMEMKGIKQSPTTLQKLFNECFEGKPVKMHTARKWLVLTLYSSTAGMFKLPIFSP